MGLAIGKTQRGTRALISQVARWLLRNRQPERVGRRVRKWRCEADQEAVLATFGGECCAARQMRHDRRRRQVAAFDQDFGTLRRVEEVSVDRALLFGEA